ncbi:uncharacterized protein LOC122947117 [Acropora millepora]|uniref:uncharacterized protein LOC122947117 n=1 Tax=Acropora millepora TaxID=45264 RepID=UPI001CF1E77D|nr:uncharacterized protein LOC122947117 [Acropora millepora]
MWRGEPDSDGSTWEFNLRSLVKITKLKIEKLQQRRRRGNDPLPKNDAHTRFIDGIGSAIAKALRWNLNVMDWIAHPDNEKHHDDPDGFLWVIKGILVLLDYPDAWLSRSRGNAAAGSSRI